MEYAASMNLSIGSVLVIIGVVLWVALAIGLKVSVDLWVLGWAFVVSGALLFRGRAV